MHLSLLCRWMQHGVTQLLSALGSCPGRSAQCFGVTSVCFIVTLATSFRWAIQDCIKSADIVAEEKRPIVITNSSRTRSADYYDSSDHFLDVCRLHDSTFSRFCPWTLDGNLLIMCRCGQHDSIFLSTAWRTTFATRASRASAQKALVVWLFLWWCQWYSTSTCNGGGLEQGTTPSHSRWHIPGNLNGEDIHDSLHSCQLHAAIFQHGACWYPPASQWLVRIKDSSFITRHIRFYYLFDCVGKLPVGMAGLLSLCLERWVLDCLNLHTFFGRGLHKLIKHFKVRSQSKTVAVYMLLPLLKCRSCLQCQ